jgi:hypothetical protein
LDLVLPLNLEDLNQEYRSYFDPPTAVLVISFSFFQSKDINTLENTMNSLSISDEKRVEAEKSMEIISRNRLLLKSLQINLNLSLL